MANAIQSALHQTFETPVEKASPTSAQLTYSKGINATPAGSSPRVTLSDKTISRFAFFRFRALGLSESRAIAGSSKLASASDGAGAIGKVLDRLGSLSSQAERDGLSEPERTALRTQFESLVGEIRQTVHGSSADGQSLLDGSAKDVTVPVVDDKGEEAEASPFDDSLDPDSDDGLSLSNISLDSPEAAKQASETIKRAKDYVAGVKNRFDETLSGVENYSQRLQNEHQEETASAVVDVDTASNRSSLTHQLILAQANEALAAQSNASPARAYDVLLN